MRDVIAGIFVGGASRRMGAPKGLLTVDGHSLVDRWRGVLGELGVEAVLVGRRPEYAAVPLVQLADAPPGIGPLGGLAALLAHAGPRRALALALACDMPFVRARDLRLLLDAPPAPVVAPRRGEDGPWEPLCALYAPAMLERVRLHIERSEHSLQRLLGAAGASPVVLPDACLRDWDRPEDRGG